MARDTVTDLPTDFARSGRSETVLKLCVPPTGPSTSRTSMLASVVTQLRRRDGDGLQKPPLLTLNLSSSSFLDTYVGDDVSEQPLYTIKTSGQTTTIKRADPWDGDTKTAEIRWPRSAPTKGKGLSDEVTIQMRGVRWTGSENLLKRGTILSAPRKFNIPNYSQSLKWKRVGNAYWCTTSAVKGPIAVFEPAVDSIPPRFEIFETLHDKNDTRPMLVHHGVSTLLLDYLVVTALFLVTDVQDWMVVKRFEGANIHIPTFNSVPDLPGMTPPRSAPGNIATSDQQWRKIMYGEPMFPKRSSRSSMTSMATSPDGLSPNLPSAEQLAKVIYGESLYPKLRNSSPAPSTSESEAASEHMFFSPRARSHSPASESIFYPHSRGSAPSHTYLDPSYYSDDDVPPVPPIPTRFSTSPIGPSRSPRSRPTSSQSTVCIGGTRRLPEPPLPPIPPLIPRPRSTPPRSMASPSSSTSREQAYMTLVSQSDPVPQLTPTGSTPRRPSRQLPQIPSTPSAAVTPISLIRASPIHSHSGTPGLTRARSQSQSHTHTHDAEKWRRVQQAPYSQRTLPSPPTSSSQRVGAVHPLQRIVSDRGHYMMKEVEDGLAHWVDGPAPDAPYDIPPPAYNSINFSPTMGSALGSPPR